MLNDLLLYFIPLAIIVTIARTPFFKGFIGELIVNVLSRLMLDKKAYKLIKNVTLPTEDGSTQIDHVIVSRYGIFVVETKNMKGWIFGGERQKTWTQVIYKTKTKFQNPLHQNYKHVKTLEGLLGLSADCFHSVIVFMGECTFKTAMPENVVYPLGYIRYVKAHSTYRLDENQVDDIVTAIETGRFKRSLRTHLNHARHVKEIVSEKEKVANATSAPTPQNDKEKKGVQGGAKIQPKETPAMVEDKIKDGNIHCKAYPSGVPDKFLEDGEQHDKVMPDQVGNYVFEKESESDSGRE